MSNPTSRAEQPCDAVDGCGAIEVILQPHTKQLGGFSVRRLLPTDQRMSVGPWVFFDHMGPAEFPAGKGINVRPHPHVNLATVTYLFEGEILHRDSLGTELPIQPGAINLMVAGKGIVHSERERSEVTATPHRLHGLQLWLALPAADEEMDPAFYHHTDDDIPALEVDGVPLRVMMGSAYGATSPVKTFADTVYVEARLKAGQRLTLPDAIERAVYVVDGRLSAQDREIAQYEMAIFSGEPGVELMATTDSRIAFIGGQPVGKRFIDWNFVSSRKERIEQAKADWKASRFPTVPGDEDEFIPLPD